MERGVCDIYVARACADARHTSDTHAFPQTTLFVVSEPRLIASSARHLLVTERKRTPHLGPPLLKVPETLFDSCDLLHASSSSQARESGGNLLETTFPLTAAIVSERGSDVVRMRFRRGSDAVRTWFGCGSDVVRMWFGRGSDVVSDVFSALAQTVWQKLRESGFQHGNLKLQF